MHHVCITIAAVALIGLITAAYLNHRHNSPRRSVLKARHEHNTAQALSMGKLNCMSSVDRAGEIAAQTLADEQHFSKHNAHMHLANEDQNTFYRPDDSVIKSSTAKRILTRFKTGTELTKDTEMVGIVGAFKGNRDYMLAGVDCENEATQAVGKAIKGTRYGKGSSLSQGYFGRSINPKVAKYRDVNTTKVDTAQAADASQPRQTSKLKTN
jgi:hypothetical protein